jgi:Sulfotransferase domain
VTGAAQAASYQSTYRRQPPPLPVRCALGLWIYGVAAPGSFLLQKLGLMERFAGAAAEGRQKRVAKNNAFRNYVPTAHDVFVMTFAKSGTNWMMQIAHQLLFHGKGEFEHIHCVVPWPDSRQFGPMSKYAIQEEDPSVWMASPEQKRVIKTHYDWDLLPYSESAHYIAVIRDPKDVFVSNYHFFGSVLGPAMPPVDTWLNLYLSEKFVMGGSWAANAAGYWAQRHRPNVRVFSFKSMKRDLRGAVCQVADFLGVRTTEAMIQAVCEKSSFAYMKRNDDKFRMWSLIPWQSEVAMVRKGTQGGSSELLSAEQQRQVDAYFMAELKRLGCDLPYEEFCDLAK